MAETDPRIPVDRDPRRPLYVQVVSQPPLGDCWCVNISNTGIGLVAGPGALEKGPAEGDEIDLEFSLPDVRSRIRVHGAVRWRHDSAFVSGQVVLVNGTEKPSARAGATRRAMSAIASRAFAVRILAFGPWNDMEDSAAWFQSHPSIATCL